MKSALIFLLSMLAFSLVFLLWLNTQTSFNMADHTMLSFFDTVAQSVLTAALLGIVFELAIWNFGDNQLRGEIESAKAEIAGLIERKNTELLKQIPKLEATSVEKISVLAPEEAASLVERVLSEHSENRNVAKSVSRIARSIIELDDRKVVKSLRNSIVVYEDGDVFRTKNSVSYVSLEPKENFRFGVFSTEEQLDAFVEQEEQLDGYWISQRAFSADGSFKGDLVYPSNLYITGTDRKRTPIELSANKQSGRCIFDAQQFSAASHARISYDINAFVSQKNPLIHIATPFVTDGMTVSLQCESTKVKRILHRLAVPFSPSITINKKSARSIEIAIDDVVFPGHGATFSLRME